MKLLEGQLDANGLAFGIVVSKFNEFVTDRLLAGALEVLEKAGADVDAIPVARVPGAFEIPLVAKRFAASGRFDAVICLGAVIRGETPHFEYISREASRGVARVSLEADLPVVFGVLTTDNVDQALARADGVERNRGAEAARTAIEMASLLRLLKANANRPRKTVKSKAVKRRTR
jgi:6,7-dimethyl-8-ribityllumazine synthase